MDALQRSDYEGAQLSKERFDLNMAAAMDIQGLDKFVSGKEVSGENVIDYRNHLQLARIRTESKSAK